MSLAEITAEFKKLSVEDKLRVMDALWDELDSPSWHEQVLKERAERVRTGEEKFEDWETTKRELRERF